jgi:hypothetical protein
MTRKEKRNTQKAKSLLLEVRNFLTRERNEAHGNDTKQQEFNINIDKILLIVDLLKETK